MGGSKDTGIRKCRDLAQSAFPQPLPPQYTPKPISHSFPRRGAGNRAPGPSVSCPAPGTYLRQSFPSSGSPRARAGGLGPGFQGFSESLLRAPVRRAQVQMASSSLGFRVAGVRGANNSRPVPGTQPAPDPGKAVVSRSEPGIRLRTGAPRSEPASRATAPAV